MTAETIIEEIKEALNGRPGQPIVLGVCQTLSTRFNRKVWIVRLATVLLGMFWTLPILAAYVILGLVLPETVNRSRGFFTGLGILARETAEKVLASLGRAFGSDTGSRSRYRSY